MISGATELRENQTNRQDFLITWSVVLFCTHMHIHTYMKARHTQKSSGRRFNGTVTNSSSTGLSSLLMQTPFPSGRECNVHGVRALWFGVIHGMNHMAAMFMSPGTPRLWSRPSEEPGDSLCQHFCPKLVICSLEDVFYRWHSLTDSFSCFCELPEATWNGLGQWKPWMWHCTGKHVHRHVCVNPQNPHPPEGAQCEPQSGLPLVST